MVVSEGVYQALHVDQLALKRMVMIEPPQRISWLTALFLCGIVTGCSRGQPPPEAHSPPLSSTTQPMSSTASSVGTNLVATVEPGAQSRSARASDERWQRAQGEDLADKQALADALGASGLVDALDDGGEMTATALLCLPLADDADLALGPLANRLPAVPQELREAYLTAFLGIAGRPERARESLDHEGAARAGEALIAAAKNEALPREHRALAISAARALAEKKLVDAAKIPTDLDPR